MEATQEGDLIFFYVHVPTLVLVALITTAGQMVFWICWRPTRRHPIKITRDVGVGPGASSDVGSSDDSFLAATSVRHQTEEAIIFVAPTGTRWHSCESCSHVKRSSLRRLLPCMHCVHRG